MLTHELQGELLHLLPEKAIYWPAQKALLLADSHLGKVMHFRKAGIAITKEAAIQNLVRLQSLIERYNPEQIIFLGDLFHSEMNFEWLEFKAFVAKHKQVHFKLIQGNHDILHSLSYQLFELHPQSLALGPFLLTHEPTEDDKLYNLCGHIHPGVRLIGKGRQSMRFPCFFFGKNQGILPAFGSFTGLHTLKPKKHDLIYVITQNEVISMN